MSSDKANVQRRLEEALWGMEGIATWEEVGGEVGLSPEEAVREVARYILGSVKAEEVVEALERPSGPDWLSDWINRWMEERSREVWQSRILRVGMRRGDWEAVEKALRLLPSRSQAERLGLLLRLGAGLVQAEGEKALRHLL